MKIFHWCDTEMAVIVKGQIEMNRYCGGFFERNIRSVVAKSIFELTVRLTYVERIA